MFSYEHDCSDYAPTGPGSWRCPVCEPELGERKHTTARRKTFTDVKPRRAISLRVQRDEERITYKRKGKGKNMKITAVRYERLAATEANKYENERVCAEAQVEEGETADDVLAQLKAWTNEKLGIEEVDEEELARLKARVARAERRRGY